MPRELDNIAFQAERLENAENLLLLAGIDPNYDGILAIMRLRLACNYRIALEQQSRLQESAWNTQPESGGDASTSSASHLDNVEINLEEEESLAVARRPRQRKKHYPLANPRRKNFKRKNAAEQRGRDMTGTKLGKQRACSSNAEGDSDEDRDMAPPPPKRRRLILVEESSTRVLRSQRAI